MIRYAAMEAHNFWLSWRKNLSSYINTNSIASRLAGVVGQPGAFSAQNILSEMRGKASEAGYEVNLLKPERFP